MDVMIKEDYKTLNGRSVHLEFRYYHHYVCMKDGFHIKVSTGRDYIAQQYIYILPANRMTKKATRTAYGMYCKFVDNIEDRLDELQPAFAAAERLDMLDREFLARRAASTS